VVDPNTPMNNASLYIYSIYYVSYTITTVGYGSHDYYTSAELLYACFLEVIATITQAYLIAILAKTLNLN
jgi:hypothetical protein